MCPNASISNTQQLAGVAEYCSSNSSSLDTSNFGFQNFIQGEGRTVKDPKAGESQELKETPRDVYSMRVHVKPWG